MSTHFRTGTSPIWEYPEDVPSLHPAGSCDGKCPICTAQRMAQEDGRAKIVGTMTWSGTETHSTLRRTLWDWLLGRPGRWVAD